MTTPQGLGWGDPTVPDYRAAHIVTITAGGVSLAVRSEVAHIFAGFIADLTATGYGLDARADDWGYALRCIRGTGPGTGRPCVLSNHSWGLAVDLNAATNPMTEDGVSHTDMPPETARLAEKWGLRWGALYTGQRRDPMHFEFMGCPNDVHLYPLAQGDEDVLTPDQAGDLKALKNYAVDNQAQQARIIELLEQLVAKP